MRWPDAMTRSTPSSTVSGPRTTVRSRARRGAAAGIGEPRGVGRRARIQPVTPYESPQRPLGFAEDPAAAVVRDVVPRPVDEDVEAVAEPHEVEQVQPQPREPSDRPAQPPAVGEVGHRVVAADRRHLPLVEVAERLGGLAPAPPQDLAGDVLAALDRRLGHLGERRAVPAGRGRDVTDGEDLGVARQREVGLDDEPSAPPDGRPGRGGEGLGGHAGRPDGGVGGDHAAVRQVHLGVLDALDPDPEAHLGAASLQRAPGPARRLLRERGEQAVGHLDEHDAGLGDRQLREVLGEHLVVQLEQPAGHLDARRSTAADHDVEVATAGRRGRDRPPPARTGRGCAPAGPARRRGA